MRRALRRACLVGVACILAACAALPPATSPGAQGAGESFALDGRFSLRIERFGEPAQAASGRLDWRHDAAGDRLLLLSPLGSGVAEIETRPGWARLSLAGGDTRESRQPDELMRQATGYALPVSRLAGWLRGRPGPGGRLEKDAMGRAARLFEDGWRIDYGYAGEQADEWPIRVTVLRDSEMELRLRIDNWRGPDE